MTDQPAPATSPLREQIAAAIYERNNPGYRWVDAHPDDVVAYGVDADAALAVVLPHGKFLGDQLRNSEQRLTETRAALDEVLRHFVHKGHPGEPCLQTGWISERTVAQWRAVLYPPEPAHDAGPGRRRMRRSRPELGRTEGGRVTWQRQETSSRCDSCRSYWNVLQDLGEEWDAAGRPVDPDGWGALIGRGLAAYLEHLGQHLPA